jgi:hypothetical protein
LNEQHPIQEDSDAAEDVAVDILQESDEIQPYQTFKTTNPIIFRTLDMAYSPAVTEGLS